MSHSSSRTRRGALAVGLAGVSAAAFAASRAAAQAAQDPNIAEHAHDFEFLVGRWRVRHHRLKGRLVGSTDWEDFAGSCTTWLTLGGFGTADDNVIEIPSGTYRAMGIRAFNPDTRQWAIWWLDARYPTRIDPPVFGRFENGAGEFMGDDTLNGRAIKVRFRWTDIDTPRPHWEQAFSPDDGATWEANWRMEFSRVRR